MAHSSTGFSRTLKRIDFLKKYNKKYKATADKKKREEFFEEGVKQCI